MARSAPWAFHRCADSFNREGAPGLASSYGADLLEPMTTPRLIVVFGLALAVRLAGGPWEPLFNGRDLAGWRQVNGTAPYTVEGGAIVGTTVAGSPNSFLATERSFGDFIFECEVKQEGGPSNSGIMFRALSTPDYRGGRVHGYQLEIDPSARDWTGGIYDEARRGWFYPVDVPPPGGKPYRYGEWNRLRIEAIGPSLRTWVNGVPVAHVIDVQTAAGFIALQVHSIGRDEAAGRRILWRDLRIKTRELQPSPPEALFIRNLVPNALSEAERAQGWRLLWDGETTRGWRPARGGAFPAAGWTVTDGVLTVHQGRPGDLVTEEEFAAFELQLEFKVSEGGNSGIKYFVMPDGKGGLVGLEFQLLDDERHPDAKNGVDGNRTTGSLYDLIPRKQLPAGAAIVPKAGEWHHARIVVTPGGHVEHWLNGILVLAYDRGSAEFRARVAKSKYAGIPGFGLARKGPILLQDHGDEVSFRSIKVRAWPAP